MLPQEVKELINSTQRKWLLRTLWSSSKKTTVRTVTSAQNLIQIFISVSGRTNGNAAAVGSMMEYGPAMASGLTEIETVSAPEVHTSLSKSLAATSKFHVPQFCSDV